MSQYENAFRTNYVVVKDPDAFTTWAQQLGLDLFEPNAPQPDGRTRYAIGAIGNDGGLPSIRYDENDEIDEEFDFLTELAAHLADGEVAILQAVGWEKSRYVTGLAFGLHADGRVVRIDLDDIYRQAADAFGVNIDDISSATY